MMTRLCLSLVLAIATISPAQAGPWKHPHSKLEVPDQLAGLNRTDIRDVENNGLDVVISFANAADSEASTIYIFRNVAGDVPIWFDRAATMFKVRPEFAAAVATAAPANYRPASPNGVAGLSQTYAIPGDKWKSTALAVLSTGEWYVKARLSSKTLSADGLAARLAQSLAAIKWPAAGGSQTTTAAVVPIAACTAPLAYAAKTELVDADLAATLMGAMLVAATTGGDAKAEPKDKGQAKMAEAWCREGKTVYIGNQLPIAEVYRSAGATNGYMLALADSGRAMTINPNSSAAVLHKDSPTSWTPRALLLDKTLFYQDVSGLAAPEQLFALLDSGKVISSAATFGKNTSISIDLAPEK